MLTIKNRAGKAAPLFLAVAALFAGCGPPGPQALLQGKKLLEEGKYPEAIEKLRTAAVLLGGTNALAYNYLGLACQEAGEFPEADRAYQRALALNRDLTEVHYNLGCLWLAQNKCDLAKTEFTAYTLRRANGPEGWLKLGAAQLRSSETLSGEPRSRELAAAEKSFSDALHLSPQNPEALTGLGLVRLRRGHAAEAAQFFTRALKEQPDYRPALLNLAIVEQANLNNRQLALERYRQYAALQPAPENLESVRAIISQLEQDLNQPRPPGSVVVASTNLPPKSAADGTPRNGHPPKLAAGETPHAASSPRPDLAVALPKPTNGITPAKTMPLPPPLATSATNPDIVQLPPEPIIKLAQDDSAGPTIAQSSTSVEPLITTSAVPATATTVKSPKRGFFRRMNPANLFEGDKKGSARVTTLPAPATTAGGEVSGEDGVSAAEQISAPPARYAYHSPAKPPAGNRSEAERALAQGVQAQQAQRLPEAIQAYRRATQLDPGSYNAWYNLGLAAAESGSLAMALTAYETALAVRPDALDARYKFALTLKQSNYPIDAVIELEKILASYPNESRAHLALGNLYAQQLHQPAKARQHYVKVLETDPRNPQAGAIRYWLMDNPR